MPAVAACCDPYLPPAMIRLRFPAALAFALLLAACGGSGQWLNSDRIERRFGSYGVDVLKQDEGRRVASLYSGRGADKVTRTFAVTELTGRPRQAYAAEHAEIVAGSSIGATFRRRGWTVGKQHIFIGEIEASAEFQAIGTLMGIQLPAALATHHYLLTISRDGRTYNYATITEVHHPDYLDADQLESIYGEILFDDSLRDRLSDFIGPPPVF